MLWFVCVSFGSLALSADQLSRTQIFEVQEKLNLLGFGSGQPDGLVGSKTRSAVAAFKSQYNLQKDNEINENLLDQIRNVYLLNADVVLTKLEEKEFLASALARVTIPEDYEFFVDSEKLQIFHAAYGPFVEPERTVNISVWDLSDYFDDCERALSEFDTTWLKFDMPSRFIRCLTALTHIHFNQPKIGIKIFENILLDWAAIKPVLHRSKSRRDEDDQSYAATMTLAGIAQFYAIYYESFNFDVAERRQVDRYLRNWLISEDVFAETRKDNCNIATIEADFKKRDIRFDTDYCGSNRWRMGLGAVYLGLRLEDEVLFRAGNRHVFWATSAIDNSGIYMPWARKGALALSYQRQLPEVLTFLADAYESVGFDFYEYETTNGAKIRDVYSRFFQFIDNPLLLEPYADAAPNFVGVSYSEFKKLPIAEQQSRELINHAILEVQSETFLNRFESKSPRIHITENWDDKWGDYIGVFVPASGVAVTFAKKLNNVMPSNSISLPKMATNLENRGDFSFDCNVRVIRSLDGLNDLLGSGIVAIDNGEGQITDFTWEISGLGDTNYLENNSAFIFTPEGKLKGSLAVHTMFGSPRLDLITFPGTATLDRAKFPEGEHIAKKIYEYTVGVKISKCGDLQTLRSERSFEDLKVTWHTELLDENYSVNLEAFDVIRYSVDTFDVTITHEDVSEFGIRGRDKLQYSLDGKNIKIVGLVDFNGDLINVNLNVPLDQRKYVITFGTEDRLVISW